MKKLLTGGKNMNTRVDTSELKKAVRALRSVTSGKTYDINAYGFFNNRGLTVTDRERAAWVKLETEGDHKVLLPMRAVEGVLKSAPDIVDIAYCPDDEFGAATINGLSFPVRVAIEHEDFSVDFDITINNWHEFIGAVRRCENCIAEESARCVFNGILVAADMIAATDGRRLVVEKIKNDWVTSPIIIPGQALKDLTAFVKIYPHDSVFVAVGDCRVSFGTPDWIYSCKTIEGNFPDVMQVMPKKHETDAIVQINDAVEAVKLLNNLMLQSKNNNIGSKTHRVTLSFGDGPVVVGLTRPDGTQGTEWHNLGTQNGKKEISVVFNIQYLIDILKPLGHEPVIIRVISENSPAVFETESYPDYTAVLMLMK